MEEVLTPDLCIIGAGDGGLSVAASAAAMGVSVVLVEKGPMDGAFLNHGALAAKVLMAGARVAHDMRGASTFGVSARDIAIDFAGVMQHVRATLSAIAPNGSEERCRALGITLLRANGRFVARDRLEAGGRMIRARRFIIATGSSPALPNIAGLEQIRTLTTETIFQLTALPAHLVVLGAQPAGLELAQAFCRLGAQVTLIEAAQALGHEDAECADLITSSLRRDGVDLRENTRVLRAEAHGEGFRLHLEDGGMIAGTHLLAASGRRANIGGLGLEAAGVRASAHGIEVGADLRTSNRAIYAIGDVAGGAHAAQYHASLVLRATLFRLRARVVPHLVPRALFTAPEMAVAGLREDAARKAHGGIRVLRWPFADNDRARAEGETAGHIKVILARNGKILGAAIVGPQAAELIGLWQLAMARDLKIGAVAGLVLPWPTLSEISGRAAQEAFTPVLAHPWLRAALGLLRKFG